MKEYRSTDWDEFIRGLKKIKFDGVLGFIANIGRYLEEEHLAQ